MFTPEPNQFQRELTAKLRQTTKIRNKNNNNLDEDEKGREDEETPPTVIRSQEVDARRAKCKSLEPPSKSNQEFNNNSKKNVRERSSKSKLNNFSPKIIMHSCVWVLYVKTG